MRYPRRRDAAEADIIKALRAAGASVEQLDGKGLPDLLVGFRGRTLLMEVKDPDQDRRSPTARGQATRFGADPRGLRDTQAKWWAAWRGDLITIVTTPAEALDIIRSLPYLSEE